MKSITTIKHVEFSLYIWGKFWASKEQGTGYASISITARICDMLRTEIWASSDLHLFSHLSDNVYEPEHIEEITEAINCLSNQCKQAVFAKYKHMHPMNEVRQEVRNNFWVAKAENTLLGIL